MKLTITPFFLGCALLAGCGSDTHSKNASLSTFLDLHAQYCEAEFTTADELVNALEKDPGFSNMASHDGIYEQVVADVSYAITPEVNGCTTDLKLKARASDRSHFGFDEFNVALKENGYRPVGEKRILQEIGLNDSELKVIEQKYISPNNIESTLVFPIEKQDQYYMTFYAEKFQYRKATVSKDSNLYEI